MIMSLERSLSVQIAVGIERADVAGVQPAAAQASRRSPPDCASSPAITTSPRQRISPVSPAGSGRSSPSATITSTQRIGPAGRAEPLAPARMVAVGDVLLATAS